MSSCLNVRIPETPCEAKPPREDHAAVMLEIGSPYDLRHDVHIHYNFQEARFEGVPENFAEFLLSSNGVLKKTSNTSSGGGSNNSCTQLLSALQATAKKKSLGVKRVRTGSNGMSSNCPSPSADCEGSYSNPLTGDPRLLLNQHFRLHFRQVPRVAVDGYEDRIPAVLIMLQQHFFMKKGHLLPHIFRESPSKADRDIAMQEINRGTFCGGAHDVRVLADLIKLWFRELPVPILHEIPADQMEKIAQTPNVAEQVEQLLGPVEKCVVLWLADLLAHVAEFQEQNHMGVDQLAIVIAPNLVRIESENPMLAVAMSKSAVDLFRAVLRARFQRRQRIKAAHQPQQEKVESDVGSAE